MWGKGTIFTEFYQFFRILPICFRILPIFANILWLFTELTISEALNKPTWAVPVTSKTSPIMTFLSRHQLQPPGMSKYIMVYSSLLWG